MLDIGFIRENKDRVAEVAKQKKVAVDIDALLAKDKDRVALVQEIEELRSLKNDINDLIQKAGSDEERVEIIAKGKGIKSKLDEKEAAYVLVKQGYDELMLAVPNVVSPDTPIGPDESGNRVLRQVGTAPAFDFAPKEHWELGKALGLIDNETAAEVSGARFTYLKGDLALLQFALVQYTLGVLTDEAKLQVIIDKTGLSVSPKPFIPVIPPVFVRPEVMGKMARLEPKDERYHIPSDDLYLVGSAEHTLGPIHMGETLPEKELPIRYVGYSTAFRREAGSYGKDMKGILRLHQFDKLEMESFTLSENAVAEQDFIVALQEHLLQGLGLAYQVVAICTGDMGKPDLRQIDIETWLPGQNKYRETHTSDLMGDYQARRLETRVKRTDGKTELAHMNDATAFAIGRTLIAIMENYQEADGSIRIPEALRGYMGKEVIRMVA
jgi:seryl-tRNA synthetase